MRNLIIGSQGLVGTAVLKEIKKSKPNDTTLEGIPLEAKTPTQRYTDVMKYETLFKVFSEYRPQVVYLTACIADVNKCEDLGTNLVNVRGMITVLRLCEQFESKLIWFSSSYVFDGNADAPYPTTAFTNPIQNYGVQKEIVERTILKSDAKFVIVRTVGVFGEERRKKNFGKQVLDAVFHGKQVFVPNDQFMNPILSVELAKISVKLAERGNGLFHVASDTCVSKFEFAYKLAKYFNLESLVVGVTSEEMNQRAPRPKMGALDCSGLKDLGFQIPSYEGGISKFLELEYGR
jgi:dTDP-4-dehydrorhamnose reductase